MRPPASLSARSAIECRLYVELRSCPCGQALEPGEHRLESQEGDLVAVYGALCRRCGSSRQFEFAMDDEIVPLGKFGGNKPSQIIDAGEYLVVAEAIAREVPADANRLGVEARDRARVLMRRAIAAMEEVLKFIRPGDDAVLRETLASARSAAMYDNEPGRFRRSRLQAVLRAYIDAVSRL